MHPARHPFAARFTGLAGQMRVRIRDRGENGTVLVEPAAGPGHPRLRAGRPRAGDTALVMIRPAGVRRCQLLTQHHDKPIA
jgi:hypothetical protein